LEKDYQWDLQLWTVMTTTKSYDYLNRLTAISSAAGGSTVVVFTYGNNPANQRTAITNVDNSRWVYQYDSLGQVISGKKYWSDGTPVAGQQFEYTFDDIGNRKNTAAGGDQLGANLRTANYTANSLNQYLSRDVPGFVNVLGTAKTNATVTVWGDNGAFSATSRKGEYFRGELAVTNTANPVWLTITNLAVLQNGSNPDIVTNTIGKALIPKTTESFYYDFDGNLTNDGRWSYTWDAENRATSFTRNSAAPTGSRVRLDCQYDTRSRRTQKIVSTWNGSAYVAQTTNKFVYDDWNLIAILDATNGLVQSFTWGLDASGSLQGAGGVGGLISMTVHQGTNAGTYFYCFDGNHNVAMLVNATNGVVEAVYELDAFLRILRATGRLAFVNPFVGSTKFCDWETGFLYYGYRYYDPETGRWLNRDPLGEHGGRNLYGFVGNAPLNRIDPTGLKGVGIIGEFVDCGLSLLSDAIDKWLDQRLSCAEIAKRSRHGSVPNPGETESYDIDLCKGFSFQPNTVQPTYDPKSLGKLLGDCIFKSLKGKTIEEALKGVTDETKRKILEELLKSASDFEATAKLTATVNAKCSGSKVVATVKYSITAQAGGLSMSEEVKSLGPFGCPALDGECCSCKHNPWKEKK